MKRYIPFIALFLSGAAALVLEVVWVRHGVLIFGTTTTSVTIVLSLFMAGLGLGNYLASLVLTRSIRPFLYYAGLEGATGVIAVTLAILGFKYSLSPQIPKILVGFLLLLPTTCMGATLPIMVAGMKKLKWTNTVSISWAYGVNTVGGAAGTILGAFYFLPELGMFRASLLASGLLFLAAILALCVGKYSTTLVVENDEQFESALSGKRSLLLALAAWSGAASLSLEIVWSRLLSLILGPSVYALGIVLFVYLAGIGLGSLLFPTFERRFPVRQKEALILVLLAMSVAWSFLSFGVLPYLFVWFVEIFSPSMSGLRFLEGIVSLIPMAPTALLHGLFLPVLISIFSTEDNPGRATGLCIGINTLGAISGSALTGLLMIPLFGFMPIVLGILTIHIVLGMALLFQNSQNMKPSTKWAFVGLALVGLSVFYIQATGAWDRTVLASGVYKYAVGDALAGKETRIEVGKILYYREGTSATVAVLETMNDRVLSIDGKADASAHGDRSTQVLLAALPMSLVQDAKDVLVIGFASGVTAGTASLFPHSRVTAVEIEPAVYEASDFFLEVNHGPLKEPHRKIVQDARYHLGTTREQYDVITSEPSNPWMSGVAPLFTEEFFTLAKSRLSSKGVMCQWLPIYGMTLEHVKSVMGTFQMVFPDVMVFESVEGFDLLMIGSESALRMDPNQMDRSWTKAALRTELSAIGIHHGIDLVGRFLLGAKEAKAFAEGFVVNTDDNGYIEYGAPLALHLATAKGNHAVLSSHSGGLRQVISTSALQGEPLEALRMHFTRRGESPLIEELQ